MHRPARALAARRPLLDALPLAFALVAHLVSACSEPRVPTTYGSDTVDTSDSAPSDAADTADLAETGELDARADDATRSDTRADDATQDDRGPPFCAIVAAPQELGPSGSCGVMDGFLPVTGCWFDYRGNSTASMLCDLASDRCTSPVRACANGWCRVPAATFLAGASVDVELVVTPPTLATHFSPPSRKRVERPFFVQDTEVTRHTFLRVMGYGHPDPSPCKGDCPAPFGSVFEAMDFANRLGAEMGLPPCYTLSGCGDKIVRLNEQELTIRSCTRSVFEGPECPGLRLPTLAEAELAARAGTPYCSPTGPVVTPESPYYAPCDPDGPVAEIASFCANATGIRPGCGDSEVGGDDGQLDLSCLDPQPVRSLAPNPFGLFDAQGNLAEFTQKVYCNLGGGAETCANPVGHTGDYDLVFVEEDAPITSGGFYLSQEPGVCSMIQRGLREAYSNYKLEILGLRLVRTDLGDCDTLRETTSPAPR